MLILLVTQKAYAQDYSWWNTIHNWDGHSHWRNYMTIAPAYMGPNALPVPKINDGSISADSYFKFALENHSSQGDITRNVFTELYQPLYDKRVGLKLHLVPLEHYSINTTTRDDRSIREFNPKGYAGGDIYIGTFIQLIQENKKLPDVLLSINLRTASGTKLEAARYSDAPGYFFDLSAGKTFKQKSNKLGIQELRPFAMIGFYAWQIYGDRHLQNDAFLYGVGVLTKLKKLEIVNSLGGYKAYLGNGDSPMVYRAEVKTDTSQTLSYSFQFQQGIFHFGYSSIRLGLQLNISKLRKQRAAKPA